MKIKNNFRLIKSLILKRDNLGKIYFPKPLRRLVLLWILINWISQSCWLLHELSWNDFGWIPKIIFRYHKGVKKNHLSYTHIFHMFIKKNTPHPSSLWQQYSFHPAMCWKNKSVWCRLKISPGREGGEFFKLGFELHLIGLLLECNPGPIFRQASCFWNGSPSPGKYTIPFLRLLVKESPVVKQLARYTSLQNTNFCAQRMSALTYKMLEQQ